ncbi:peptidylprolyl isomerase [Solimonas flava]|uniref:peptidylprolyl isomerase n=1 Tax=Solimonas flava TaxID=415849 RepID=UPI00040708AB|nr:peptidylprolyl isomerase [Solimonas flava]
MRLPRLTRTLLRTVIGPGAALAVGLAGAAAPPPDTASAPSRTLQQVLDATQPSDWRPLDADHALLLELPAGRVVIELAPAFAPAHVANLKTLVRARYFDGLAILRVQDGYVTQWGDPLGADDERARPLGKAAARLAPEFTRAAAGLAFNVLPDADTYAPETGFVDGFPAARDRAADEAWLTHCYGMVGAARADDPQSGPGSELYVVIGQAPRQLDRNIALVGRVVQGMEHLSALPRGSGPLGFYTDAEPRPALTRVRLVADLPAAERPALELLRTDTATFAALVESRRQRRDDWYRRPAGRIDVCNVPLPVRAAVTATR